MRSPSKRYDYRRVVMTCNRCGHARLRCHRGTCPRCREGMLVNTDARRVQARKLGVDNGSRTGV